MNLMYILAFVKNNQMHVNLCTYLLAFVHNNQVYTFLCTYLRLFICTYITTKCTPTYVCTYIPTWGRLAFFHIFRIKSQLLSSILITNILQNLLLHALPNWILPFVCVHSEGERHFPLTFRTFQRNPLESNWKNYTFESKFTKDLCINRCCLIVFDTLYQNGEIYTKLPIGHKIYQMAVKCSKWPNNIPTFSIPKPFKIYPNWYFWFENKPSGNPGTNVWHKVRRSEIKN
jgi:hypothetical protein